MSARVLVVDDIAANVRLLEAKLAAEYFEVMTASSGKEALALIEKQTPDIVLLDLAMPGPDGFTGPTVELGTGVPQRGTQGHALAGVLVTRMARPRAAVPSMLAATALI